MVFSAKGSTAPNHPVPGFLAKYPTPFHVYNEAAALEDAAALQEGLFSGLRGAELFYSVKTNPLLPLLSSLLAKGWGLEVVGNENVAQAVASGCPGSRMLYSEAGWKLEELEEAIHKKGIRSFTVDSLSMARLLGRACGREKLNIAFRIHDGHSHFGFPILREAITSALAAIPPTAIESFGLHVHTNPHGSPRGIDEIREDFTLRARRLKNAIQQCPREVEFVNLGGGIDSPFVFRPHPAELARFHNPNEAEAFRREIPGERFSLRDAGAAAAEAVVAELGPQWRERRVLFEPGRSVCTRALSTVLGVRAVKEGFYPDAQVVITDGNTAILGPLHRGMHPLYPQGKVRTFVYGLLPHSGDWLFQDAHLPALKEGDRLQVENTGAYFLPLEARFGHELPSIFRADRDERIR